MATYAATHPRPESTAYRLQFQQPISSLIGIFAAAGRRAFITLTSAATFWASVRNAAACSESGW